MKTKVNQINVFVFSSLSFLFHVEHTCAFFFPARDTTHLRLQFSLNECVRIDFLKKKKTWPLLKRWSNKAARRPRLALWLSLRLTGRGPIIFPRQRQNPTNVWNVYWALLRFTLVWMRRHSVAQKRLCYSFFVHFQNVDKLGTTRTDWSIVSKETEMIESRHQTKNN